MGEIVVSESVLQYSAAFQKTQKTNVRHVELLHVMLFRGTSSSVVQLLQGLPPYHGAYLAC